MRQSAGIIKITGGVYGIIGRPSFLGLLLSGALAFRSGSGMLLTALLLPPLFARVRAEERLLRAQFGGEYEGCRARTWRLVPGIYSGGEAA